MKDLMISCPNCYTAVSLYKVVRGDFVFDKNDQESACPTCGNIIAKPKIYQCQDDSNRKIYSNPNYS